MGVVKSSLSESRIFVSRESTKPEYTLSSVREKGTKSSQEGMQRACHVSGLPCDRSLLLNNIEVHSGYGKGERGCLFKVNKPIDSDMYVYPGLVVDIDSYFLDTNLVTRSDEINKKMRSLNELFVVVARPVPLPKKNTMSETINRKMHASLKDFKKIGKGVGFIYASTNPAFTHA